MACIRIVLAVFLLTALQEAVAVTPVQKVLTMMNEMKAKGEAMMKEEATTYASYKEWVADTSRELGFEIKTGKSDIEKFTAAATKADADVAKLTEVLAKANADLQATEYEKSDAIEVRKSQCGLAGNRI